MLGPERSPTRPPLARPHRISLAAGAGALLAMLLSACGTGSGGAADQATDPTTARVTPTPTAPLITEVDFGELEWTFASFRAEQADAVQLVGGTATVGPYVYTVGEPVYSDADGDGADDAIVPIQRADGNGVEILHYVWLADADVPVQLDYPVARGARCGDAVTGVTAVEGGFRVVEALRTAADVDVPCSEPGPTVRERVIGVFIDGAGVAWPTQLAPVAAAGVAWVVDPAWQDEASPSAVVLRSAPDESAPVVAEGDAVPVFNVFIQPAAAVPGWNPVGFVVTDEATGEKTLACGWYRQP
ncbi:hypothetical protein KXS11_11225 [Plantibacter flavus]|uniref:hypothetical protein n=1 Tax=Plantibacter flavus TaxID=150123 RepID=UPI003F154669